MLWKVFFSVVPFFLSFLSATADTECPVTLSPPIDRRANKSTLTIMHYNVEWLFIDYYKSANCPGKGCTWVNSSEANIHLQYVSKVIQDVNPDILNLCEVEGCDELNMLTKILNQGSQNSNTYVPYLKQGTDTSTGQNVGMITRLDPLINLYRTDQRVNYPIEGSLCGYTGSPGSSAVTKHYITEYKWGNLNVAFIGIHFLAYPDDPARCVQREAQAQVIQNVIQSYYNRSYEIILMGDFNDFDAEVIDANNNKPISRVLDIVKGNLGIYKGTYELENIAATLEKSHRFSDWWDSNVDCVSTPSEFSMIDHILISPKLREKVIQFSIYQKYEEFCGKYNSDHYPLVIKLSL